MTETISGRAAPKPALSIVGAGRAGSALAIALRDAGHTITAVCSRTAAHAEQVAQSVAARVVPTPVEAIERADLTLLTVPDTAIAVVAATVAATGVPLDGRAVIHCSARLGPEAAGALRPSGADVGVLHPLQAMSGAESAPLLCGATFRVEATSDALVAQLHGIVTSLGGRTLHIAAEDRDLYHAAAVLAGNAPLALLGRGVELLMQCGVEREDAHAALSALMAGAAANAHRQGAGAALTGPVVRGDAEAIAAHRAALGAYPDALSLYDHMVAEMERLLGITASEAVRPSLHRVA